MLSKSVERELRLELARKDLYGYCELKSPDFYNDEIPHLKSMCDSIQSFLFDSDKKLLILCMPPRFGKSRTMSNTTEWLFGYDKTLKIMTASYNETLSTQFSKNVRNTIQEEKASEDIVVYSDIFPDVKIKSGDGAMNLWSIVGGYQSYLATSPTGTSTGFGADIIIIDDLIKSAYEASNKTLKDQRWTWFTDTMISRLEPKGKIIVVQTRWATDDLIGRLKDVFPADEVTEIIYKAYDETTGKMLSDKLLDHNAYLQKKKLIGEDIFMANYQQVPLDIKGKLYGHFKTYEVLPELLEIKAYCDTADTGKDYLCNIVYGVGLDKQLYVLDVVYSKEPMEITERLVSLSLIRYKVNVANIESNNGGRGFARQVQRILQDEYGHNTTVVKWFTQTKNKVARIISNSSLVQDKVHYPYDWKERFSDYYTAMNSYQKEGKNEHDDAPDATTGMVELESVQVRDTQETYKALRGLF